MTVETQSESYKTFWTLERDGSYKKKRIPIRGGTSWIDLPGNPAITTGTEKTKSKVKVTVTWNGPAGVPSPTKAYVYCYAQAGLQPGRGTMSVGLPKPKIAEEVNWNDPIRSSKNGDAIRVLSLSGGTATTEFEGNAEVEVVDANFGGGRGASGMAEWGGSAVLTPRVLSLSTSPSVTYEMDPNAPIVQLFPPRTAVKNENMDDLRIVTAFGSAGHFFKDVGGMPVGLWHLPTTTVELAGGDVNYRWGERPGMGTRLEKWVDVYAMRKSPSPKEYTITGRATDQTGVGRNGQVKFEVHAPLEEMSEGMIEPKFTPWVEARVYASADNPRTVTHGSVRTESESREIGHSVSFGMDTAITEFAKLSYNASASHKIGVSYQMTLSESQSVTVPGGTLTYPGTTIPRQYSIQLRETTPQRRFKCRHYDFDGYQGLLEQTVDLNTASEMRMRELELLR